MNNPCKQLCAFALLTFLLVNCAPRLAPSAYPNPVLATIPPNATRIMFPTFTPTHLPPLPPSQDFGQGDLAQVSRNKVQSLSEEEIVKLLVGQWLQRYQDNQLSPEAITDYSIEKVEVRSRPSDTEVIVGVQFSVIPVRYSANWASIGVGRNAPWEHVAGYFSVFQDGEYYKLKFLPGWGS